MVNFKKWIEKVEQSKEGFSMSLFDTIRVNDNDFLYIDDEEFNEEYESLKKCSPYLASDYSRIRSAMERFNVKSPYGDYKCMIREAQGGLLCVFIEVIPFDRGDEDGFGVSGPEYMMAYMSRSGELLSKFTLEQSRYNEAILKLINDNIYPFNEDGTIKGYEYQIR